jgi:hypothetical protein
MLALARDVAGERPAPLARLQTWLTAAIERCGGGDLPVSSIELIALVAALAAVFGTVLLRSLRLSERA